MPYLLTLDTLTCGGHFDGIFPVSADGVEYVLSDLTGWWGSSPAPELKHTKRPTAHGAHRSAAYRGTRSVTVKVTATSEGQDPAQMRVVEQRLAALCSDPAELYPLAVDDQAGTKVAYVELDGEIVSTMRDGLDWSSVVSIPLIAADPLRYDRSWVSAAAPAPTPGVGGIDFSSGAVFTGGLAMGTAATPAIATATGLGTARSQLVLEVDGPTYGVQVADLVGTSVIGLRGQTLAGQSTFINCSDQPAFDVPGCSVPIPANGAVSGGANARGGVTVLGGWPRVKPGEVHPFQLTGSFDVGAGLTVHTRAAYW